MNKNTVDFVTNSYHSFTMKNLLTSQILRARGRKVTGGLNRSQRAPKRAVLSKVDQLGVFLKAKKKFRNRFVIWMQSGSIKGGEVITLTYAVARVPLICLVITLVIGVFLVEKNTKIGHYETIF